MNQFDIINFAIVSMKDFINFRRAYYYIKEFLAGIFTRDPTEHTEFVSSAIMQRYIINNIKQ